MVLGLGRLRLTPDIFWSLTPKELLLIAGGGSRSADALSRDALGRLMQRFPDEPERGCHSTATFPPT